MYTLEQCWEVGLLSTYRRCRFWQKKKIIFSDEAHFNLSGYVNKQNSRIRGKENPHAYIEKPTSYCWVRILVPRHNYCENHGNVAECVRKLRTDFGRKEAPLAPYVRILIHKPKREKPKTVLAFGGRMKLIICQIRHEL